MRKILNEWKPNALHLYAQSEGSTAVMQILKIITGTRPEIEVTPAIEQVISGEFFDHVQAKRTLYEMNHDVVVEVFFHDESRKVTMPYAVLQDKLVSWTEQGVGVTWWPVNFQTYDEAKTFTFKYLTAAQEAASKTALTQNLK